MTVPPKAPSPLRWKFLPVAKDGVTWWKWAAYTLSGEVQAESKEVFASLLDCVADAHEYLAPSAA